MAARVAYPTGGNPADSSCAIDFELADDAGAGTPDTLLGWSATESTGSATASVRLHDGTTADDPAVAPLINLAEGGMSQAFPTNGIQVTSGAVFLEVVSGSVEVCVYW